MVGASDKKKTYTEISMNKEHFEKQPIYHFLLQCTFMHQKLTSINVINMCMNYILYNLLVHAVC